MINESPLSSAPYTHTGNSVQRTMLLVILALMPATLLSLYLFGWPAIYLFIVTIATVLVAEAISLKIAG
jgi:electron transport complex protein RnfD